ncbi:hypothetical protein F4821DRAFT_170423 [Hypoxylon rubiginosum]|uniref:Uncharacterized protein n=1 Tax=Hypoxylon rubiginosum TaxID=110542 RepID=A0ACC0CVS0_9PEZI|nr:hypothetical protein F4821DRAFT_170423 [Hypoxylon rubiginosum]
MSTRLWVFGLIVFFASLLLATPGDATQFRASSHGRPKAEPLPVAPSTNLRFGVTVDRFSVVDPKRSTVNMTDIHARHLHKLARRVDCDDPTSEEQECRRPPTFPMPACFWCPKPATKTDDISQFLDQFSTDEFKKRTRATRADLVDTCMFYSRPIHKPPNKLSRLATQLACQYNKYSIWHLWPNKANHEENNAFFDFYGMFDRDSPLFPITEMDPVENTDPPKPQFIVYFENMSEAMAQMCTGKIYLLTQTPQNLAQYGVPPLAPNIWSEKELPALRNHLRELSDVLITIDATQLPTVVAWRVNWRTLDSEGTGTLPNRKEEIWVPYNMTEELAYGPMTQQRANLCENSGIDEEPDDYDFFG